MDNIVGKKIRQRREELHMTQDELALKMGYKSRSTIAKIECGENDLNQTKVVAFAKALDTTPSFLMGWVDDFVVMNDTEFLVESYNNLNDEGKEQLKTYMKYLNAMFKEK